MGNVAMSEFNPPIFAYGDEAGRGRWEIGHYRQHLNYLTHLAALSPPILIPDHPLMRIGDSDLEQKLWLEDHANTHGLLRAYANVTGVDLSAVDLDDEQEFYVWLDAHAQEHLLIDQAFGL